MSTPSKRTEQADAVVNALESLEANVDAGRESYREGRYAEAVEQFEKTGTASELLGDLDDELLSGESGQRLGRAVALSRFLLSLTEGRIALDVAKSDYAIQLGDSLEVVNDEQYLYFVREHDEEEAFEAAASSLRRAVELARQHGFDELSGDVMRLYEIALVHYQHAVQKRRLRRVATRALEGTYDGLEDELDDISRTLETLFDHPITQDQSLLRFDLWFTAGIVAFTYLLIADAIRDSKGDTSTIERRRFPAAVLGKLDEALEGFSRSHSHLLESGLPDGAISALSVDLVNTRSLALKIKNANAHHVQRAPMVLEYDMLLYDDRQLYDRTIERVREVDAELGTRVKKMWLPSIIRWGRGGLALMNWLASIAELETLLYDLTEHYECEAYRISSFPHLSEFSQYLD